MLPYRALRLDNNEPIYGCYDSFRFQILTKDAITPINPSTVSRNTELFVDVYGVEDLSEYLFENDLVLIEDEIVAYVKYECGKFIFVSYEFDDTYKDVSDYWVDSIYLNCEVKKVGTVFDKNNKFIKRFKGVLPHAI